MLKRYAYVLFCALLAVCLQCALASAGQGDEEARAKLNKMRREIAQVKHEHSQEVSRVNKKCDNNVSSAREQFHKARARAIEEKKGRLEALGKSYDDELQPMLDEEKSLLESITPAQGDFVKRKEDRRK